jgi:hypothetical protein
MIKTLKTTVIALLLTSLAVSGSAQINIDDEIELSRTLIQTQRKAIVSEAMQLTEAQSKVFWPLYREMQAELTTVGDREVALIASYASNYGALTEERARELIDEWLAIEKARLKVLGKYVKRFRKILPEKVVARYFQLENKLDAVINAELASQIPLVE